MKTLPARSREAPQLQSLPVRPGLSEIIAATSREFGVGEGEFRRRRHTPARLALVYLARHEGALKLPEFAPALGVRDWAASHLATSAERLAQKDRGLQQNLRRIRLSFSKLTDSPTGPKPAVRRIRIESPAEFIERWKAESAR